MPEETALSALIESMTGEPSWKLTKRDQIEEPMRSALLDFACRPFEPRDGALLGVLLDKFKFTKADLTLLCRGYGSLPSDRTGPHMSEREFIGQAIGKHAKRVDPEWMYRTLSDDTSGTGWGLMMHLWRSPMSRERKLELVGQALRARRLGVFSAIDTARRSKLYETCPDLDAIADSPDMAREIRTSARRTAAKLRTLAPPGG